MLICANHISCNSIIENMKQFEFINGKLAGSHTNLDRFHLNCVWFRIGRPEKWKIDAMKMLRSFQIRVSLEVSGNRKPNITYQNDDSTLTLKIHDYIRYSPLLYTYIHWLVGWAAPLKNMKVSWDDDIPNIWKVIKFMFQTTNQICIAIENGPVQNSWFSPATKWVDLSIVFCIFTRG